MTDKTYKVFLTPLIDVDTYGTEIEISDYVASANLGTIKKNTDSDDGIIGEYLLGSFNMTCANFCGEFNDADPRSFFKFKRDNSKIRVVYYDSLTDSSASFKGLVNEDGTVDGDNELVKIKVLALEAILRKVQVGGGTVSAGMLFSDAIKALLNQSAITAVLTYDPAEISVGLDLQLDNESPFTNISTWEAVKQLLIASNSVVYIDDETIKVKNRDYHTDEISYFYGPGDTLDRENIIKISKYNNGAHRIFNSVKINDTLYTDTQSKDWFGLAQISFTLEFITDTDKETQIARELVEQFRYPRIEFEMTIPTVLVNEVDFFDTIGVSHPIRSKAYPGTDGALWDMAKYDSKGPEDPVFNNLIAHYSMDRISAAVLADETGSFPGTLINGPQQVPGYLDKALDFDPTSTQYIDCGTAMGDFLGNNVSEFSISLWVNPDTISGSLGFFYIGNFLETQGEFSLRRYDNNTIFRMSNSSFNKSFVGPAVGSWAHILVEYTGSAGKAYLNGVKVIDSPHSTNLNLAGLKTVLAAYYSSAFAFNGKIDQVRIYNRALAESEVAELYNEKVGPWPDRDVYNVDFGGTSVDGRLAFKIIQRTENPKEFLTTLKMRGRGKTFDDGVLIHWKSIWDQSIYDISTW